MTRYIRAFKETEKILFGDHKGGGAVRRETASEPVLDRTPVTSEEYIAAYSYKTDPLIRHDLLRKLRKEHPEISILRIPHYPLYSPHITIYKLDRNKMFKGDRHE